MVWNDWCLSGVLMISSRPYRPGVDKFYGERDEFSLGQTYCDHVQAMTTEGLSSKSDIAAELAYRDVQIAQLKAQLSDARLANYKLLTKFIRRSMNED